MNSDFSPAAIPIPPSTPATEAASPTTTASARVAPSTWPRAAPSARSSAFSLVRCATTMAKVLWMVKVATSSAMPAKTSSRVVNMVRKRLDTCAVASSETFVPVTASSPAGSFAVSAVTSSCWETPPEARNWIEVAWPCPFGVR